jgi:hypothetical protein
LMTCVGTGSRLYLLLVGIPSRLQDDDEIAAGPKGRRDDLELAAP